MKRVLRASTLSLLTVAIAAACSSGDGSKDDELRDGPRVFLEPTAHLVRASMALRGMRPSVEDLEAVRADASALGAIIDGYLNHDGFGEMVRDLHNEALTARVGAVIYPAGFPAVGALSEMDVQRINVAVTEAPLRLIEHVVMNDRPYTEIVTADYTVADEVVATVWGMPYDGSGRTWEVTRYDDGRPHAGVLSDSWLWTRHSTTFSNQNRGRANAISRALLCNDFISRQLEVDTSINLADAEEVANAVENNAACASCHQSLDPLAGYFGQFQPLFVPSDETEYPLGFYLPELGELFTVRSPGYFGFSGGDVQHLGAMIAQDPRFSLCAARRFYSYFHQIPLDAVPLDRAAELQSALTASWSAKELAKAIVMHDDFRLSYVDSEDPEQDRRALFKSRPWQLARSMADLTGFRWETRLDIDIGTGNVGLVDMMTDNFFGFEVLAGGIDSVNVTIPAHTMTATTSLVLGALASQGAERVAEDDFAFPSSAKLLRDVTETDRDEAKIRAQLVALHAKLYGQLVESDSEDVTLAYALFEDALADGGDVKRAWKTVLYAMLQDVRMAYY